MDNLICRNIAGVPPNGYPVFMRVNLAKNVRMEWVIRQGGIFRDASVASGMAAYSSAMQEQPCGGAASFRAVSAGSNV
ncbi:MULTISPECIES: hypothetical protein [unclassified Phaeobacter]|uniref:hypothetical protein n=1 Tax=unclassified Phaeobacter TaxID=2621772 RepID=UPI003A89A8D5